jgi:hypothetical protein
MDERIHAAGQQATDEERLHAVVLPLIKEVERAERGAMQINLHHRPIFNYHPHRKRPGLS